MQPAKTKDDDNDFYYLATKVRLYNMKKYVYKKLHVCPEAIGK